MSKKEKSEAAEKIVKAEKEKAKKPKSDKPNFFVRAGKAIVRFVKDFRGETKKIVWPDAKTVLKNTGVVLAVVAVFLVFIFLVDQGLSLAIGELGDLARNAGASVTQEADDHDHDGHDHEAVPHDHDGDGIPDHDDDGHDAVPHDHDGDGIPDHDDDAHEDPTGASAEE
ncbi:MAG: preprotein translocase subunit SecE [Oscillospiraceae bacterium]|nr:preprotein translocase subunit SecE [Oscillospiraceae bacterium]